MHLAFRQSPNCLASFKELQKRVTDVLTTVPADAPVTVYQKAMEGVFVSTDNAMIYDSLECLKKLNKSSYDTKTDQARSVIPNCDRIAC
jgi:hypothetical protein